MTQTKRFRDVDDVLYRLNGYGRYQRTINGMLACLMFPISFPVLIMYFVAGESKWRCKTNSTVCLMKGTLDSRNNYRCNISRTEWEYVTQKDHSIISEFQLDCGNEWLAHSTTSIHYIGWAIGALVLGVIANVYGRKRVIFTSLLVIILTVAVSSFATNIYVFLVCRFIIGFATPVSVLYVMVGELVDDKHRFFASFVVLFMISCAWFVLTLKAYYIKNWRSLLQICSIPYLCMLVFYKFVPESIRWMYVNNKEVEVMKECRRIAKWNKVELPSDLSIAPPHIEGNNKRKPNIIDLFRTRMLVKLMLALMFSWFMVNALYYGMFLTADDFQISKHVSFILFTIIDMPATLLGCFFNDRYGRRKTIPLCTALGAIISILLAIIPMNNDLIIVRLVLGVLGKGFFVGSFNGLITWTVEILTTDIRTLGMGVAAATGRTGGLLCPWIADSLKNVHIIAPFVAIGTLGILTSVVMRHLPETLGVSMQDVSREEESEEVSQPIIEEQVDGMNRGIESVE